MSYSSNSSYNTNETIASPPEHLLSDYIEIAYLGVIVLTGLPSNLYILTRLISQKHSIQKDGIKMGFMLLKINLCINDMLLIILALIKCIWLSTYQWPGDDALCRLSQLFSMFCFYGSSNIMVCIAFDRLRNVLNASKICTNNVKAVKRMLLIAWSVAFVEGLGQLVVWRTIDISNYYHFKEPFIQCTDIWLIYRTFNETSGLTPLLHNYVEYSYKITNLVLVFWGPLVVLFVCYAVIAYKLMRYSRSRRPTNSSTKFKISEKSESAELSIGNGTTSIIRKMKNASLSRQNKISLISRKRSSQNSVNSILLSDDIGESKLPSWRKQLRSRVFRTTLLIVLLHFVTWFPFNAHAICYYVNESLYSQLSDHANIFKHIQFLIVLINPFIYGFS